VEQTIWLDFLIQVLDVQCFACISGSSGGIVVDAGMMGSIPFVEVSITPVIEADGGRMVEMSSMLIRQLFKN
jgi:hypothetical protein